MEILMQPFDLGGILLDNDTNNGCQMGCDANCYNCNVNCATGCKVQSVP